LLCGVVATVLCLGIMLGSVVAVGMVFYVVQATANDGDLLDLDNIQLSQSSMVVATDPDTGDVLLRITDDGVGMPPEQVAHLLDEPAEGAEKAEKFRHVGLWNVNRRIRYSFGEGYGLTIESEEDVGTEVTIRLPYQQKGDSHAADITGG